MAFLEMGIFGNPRQEALSFDFYNESGKLMSHYAVVSFDRLERIESGGDFLLPELGVNSNIPGTKRNRDPRPCGFRADEAIEIDWLLPDRQAKRGVGRDDDTLPRDTQRFEDCARPCIAHRYLRGNLTCEFGE